MWYIFHIWYCILPYIAVYVPMVRIRQYTVVYNTKYGNTRLCILSYIPLFGAVFGLGFLKVVFSTVIIIYGNQKAR